MSKAANSVGMETVMAIGIGEFDIHQLADGTFWINNGGEGMQTSEEKLADYIRKFYAENF